MRNIFSLYKQYIYLVVVIPLLILLLIIIGGLINYAFIKKDRENVYLNELSKITMVLNNDFNYIEKFAITIGNKIVKESDYSPQHIGEILKKSFLIAKISQDIETLTTFDFVTLDGKLIANATEGGLKKFPLVGKEERLWLKLAPLNPGKLIIDPKVVKGIVEAKQVVDYGIPAGVSIRDEHGNIVGIISAGINIEKLINKITETFNSNNIRFLLFNTDFDLIAQSNLEPTLLDKNLLKSLLPSTSNRGSLSKKIKYGNGEYFVYQRMDNYPFIILVGEDSYIITQLFRERVFLPAILSLMICMLIFTLFLFFRNKLIIPIKILSDIARFIPEGTPNILIPKKYNSLEISNLVDQIQKISSYTNEINSIRTNLEDTKKKLENVNQYLEQKVRERTSELEHALAAKTEFLNNMSHEIRTPIQGFTTISDGLVEHWQDFDDQRKFELASQISKNARRLSSLLKHVLDLAIFNAGKMLLDLKPCNLNDLITSSIEECKELYINGKQLEIQFSKEDIPLVTVDQEYIGQVLRNLLTNAIKFSPRNSVITIQLTLAEISYHNGKQSKTLHFTIKDQGVGIPDTELNSIFAPFTQSARTKTKAGGTGLGLAIVREIIEAHHGKIWAENNLDQGSSFHFIIPINHSKLLDNHKIIAENVSESKNILMIDDEETCLVAMELLLHNTNYKLIKAISGKEGLDYIKNHADSVDLVLLDLMIPDMYGLNILAEIKQNSLISHVPVILQSGTSDLDGIERAYELGIVAYIKKPYQK